MSNTKKFKLKNVLIFDGAKLIEGGSVTVEDGMIVHDAPDAVEIDCEGKLLFPGLIDGHAHIHSAEDLVMFSKYGVTTVLDMGTGNRDVFGSLRGGHGKADVRSAGIPGTSAEGRHGKSGKIPKSLLIAEPADAAPWVENRIADGSDYIKIMAEIPGIDQERVDAICLSARVHGRLSVAHATTLEAFQVAVRGKVDVLTHMPLDREMDSDTLKAIKDQGCVVVPTLIKMHGTCQHEANKHLAYTSLVKGIAGMREASIPIFAGSDANKSASGVAKVGYGTGLQEELELLVEAGMSPVEALKAATELPARYFGLEDRGKIEVGMRADLLLLERNPLEDIKNIRLVSRVWCGGVESDTQN